MAKDPSFPFYAQDYIVYSLRWSKGMKGLHLDLMAESWINGPLSDEDGHPAGLAGEDIEYWERIKYKWQLTDDGWINKELEETRYKRECYREKQKEFGRKGGRPKKSLSEMKEEKVSVQGKLSLSETAEIPYPFINNNGTKTHIENESANENENAEERENAEAGLSNRQESELRMQNINPVLGGLPPVSTALIPRMLEVWKSFNREYPEDVEKDYYALQKLAKFIAKRLAIEYDVADQSCVDQIIGLWGNVSKFVSEHSFFKNYSLTQIDTHSQNVIQSLNDAGRKKNIQDKSIRGAVIPAGTREYGRL